MGLFDILFGTKSLVRKSTNPSTQKAIIKDWENINILLSQKSPSQLRNALIIADRSLDNALRDVADGESMGDRLKNVVNMFDRDLYNKIWESHKIRNNLVHESGYEPPHFVIIEAIQNLKTALQSLGLRI